MSAAWNDDDGADVPEELRAAIDAEIEDLKSRGKLARIEPRCKICRDKPTREAVNKLLAQGLTKPAILSILDSLNSDRPVEDQITWNNLDRHQRRHFDAARPAAAVYDRIIDKHVDAELADVVGVRVNAMSYLAIMMSRGLHNLVDDDTVVDYTEGARAALQLHRMKAEAEGSGAQRVAELMAQQSRIIDAVRIFVPADQHQALMDHIEGRAMAVQAIEAVVDDEDEIPDDDGMDDD